MRGETVQLEKDTPESVAAEEPEADPLANATDETVPGRHPENWSRRLIRPCPPRSTQPPIRPLTPQQHRRISPPVADPSQRKRRCRPQSLSRPRTLPPVNESAPMDEPAMDDVAAAPPAPDLASAGDAISVLTAPDGAASAPDSAAHCCGGSSCADDGPERHGHSGVQRLLQSGRRV